MQEVGFAVYKQLPTTQDLNIYPFCICWNACSMQSSGMGGEMKSVPSLQGSLSSAVKMRKNKKN